MQTSMVRELQDAVARQTLVDPTSSRVEVRNLLLEQSRRLPPSPPATPKGAPELISLHCPEDAHAAASVSERSSRSRRSHVSQEDRLPASWRPTGLQDLEDRKAERLRSWPKLG